MFLGRRDLVTKYTYFAGEADDDPDEHEDGNNDEDEEPAGE
jgi:hypothetical protein